MTEKLRRLGNEIDVAEVAGCLRDIPARCLNDVRRITTDCQSQLELLWERELLQREHYEAFREENKLSRVAKYTASPIAHYAFIVALIAATALTLGVASGSRSDFVVRLPTSWESSLALLAVVVPFIVGAGIFRSVDHVRLIRRVTAWLAAIVTAGFIGGLAIFVAYHVGGTTESPGITIRSPIDVVLAGVNAFRTDMGAGIGFSVVTLAGLLAFLIAYRLDDPCPGYGAVQRSYYRAREERERENRQLRKRINAIVDVAEAELADAIGCLKSQIKQFGTFVAQSKRMQAQLGDFDVALEDSCNVLLDRYRAANEAVRKTESPTSFSEHICFRSDDDPSSAVLESGKERLEAFDRGMAEFEAELVQIRQQLRDLNWRAINDLESAMAGGNQA